MSKLVEAHNFHIFFDEVKKERKLDGGFEVVSKNDQDFRYSRGKVYSAAEGVPLEEGDEFLYEVRHAFDVYINDRMFKVVPANRVLGKVE